MISVLTTMRPKARDTHIDRPCTSVLHRIVRVRLPSGVNSPFRRAGSLSEGLIHFDDFDRAMLEAAALPCAIFALRHQPNLGAISR
jgi:hypothetical protein